MIQKFFNNSICLPRLKVLKFVSLLISAGISPLKLLYAEIEIRSRIRSMEDNYTAVALSTLHSHISNQNREVSFPISDGIFPSISLPQNI